VLAAAVTAPQASEPAAGAVQSLLVGHESVLRDLRPQQGPKRQANIGIPPRTTDVWPEIARLNEGAGHCEGGPEREPRPRRGSWSVAGCPPKMGTTPNIVCFDPIAPAQDGQTGFIRPTFGPCSSEPAVTIVPCTPLGIIELLALRARNRRTPSAAAGRHRPQPTIVGQAERPFFAAPIDHATVTICHSKTVNPGRGGELRHSRRGIGRPGFVKRATFVQAAGRHGHPTLAINRVT